jgi:hypothetical protein
MTVTLEKLRALRRQAGETASGNRAGEDGVPQALFAAPVAGAPRPDPGAQLDALRRMLGVRQRHAPAPLASRDRSIPGIEIEPGLFLAESTQPMRAPPSVPLAFAKREDSVDTDALLFFDTETTGLAGGTGTRAFMIGAADWRAGTLRIRQLTIVVTVAYGRTAGWPRSNARRCASSVKTTCRARKRRRHGCRSCAAAHRTTCAAWPSTTCRTW